jgi:hypothetical protein
VLFAVIVLSLVAIPIRPDHANDRADPNNLLLDGLVRWDSFWYAGVAESGYYNVEPPEPSPTVFFPLYPLTIRALTALTGNFNVSGVLISNAAFFVALLFRYRLAALETDGDTARRAVWYLAASPISVFFAALYTESLFLALSIVSLYFVRRRLWIVAALAGAGAAATRSAGVALAVGVAAEALWPQVSKLLGGGDPKGDDRGIVLPALLSALGIVAGLGAYILYLALTFNAPFTFITSQAAWRSGAGTLAAFPQLGQLLLGAAQPANWLTGKIQLMPLLDALAAVAMVPVLVTLFRRFSPAISVFTLTSAVLPLLSGSLLAVLRFNLAIAPVYLALALWGKRETVDRVILVLFLPFAALLAILFSHWYFIE